MFPAPDVVHRVPTLVLQVVLLRRCVIDELQGSAKPLMCIKHGFNIYAAHSSCVWRRITVRGPKGVVSVCSYSHKGIVHGQYYCQHQVDNNIVNPF